MSELPGTGSSAGAKAPNSPGEGFSNNQNASQERQGHRKTMSQLSKLSTEKVVVQGELPRGGDRIVLVERRKRKHSELEEGGKREPQASDELRPELFGLPYGVYRIETEDWDPVKFQSMIKLLQEDTVILRKRVNKHIEENQHVKSHEEFSRAHSYLKFYGLVLTEYNEWFTVGMAEELKQDKDQFKDYMRKPTNDLIHSVKNSNGILDELLKLANNVKGPNKADDKLKAKLEEEVWVEMLSLEAYIQEMSAAANAVVPEFYDACVAVPTANPAKKRKTDEESEQFDITQFQNSPEHSPSPSQEHAE